MEYLSNGLCLDEPPQLYSEITVRERTASPDLEALACLDVRTPVGATFDKFLHTPRKPTDDGHLTQTAWYKKGITRLDFYQVSSGKLISIE